MFIWEVSSKLGEELQLSVFFVVFFFLNSFNNLGAVPGIRKQQWRRQVSSLGAYILMLGDRWTITKCN